jgi:hypothetical protein
MHEAFNGPRDRVEFPGLILTQKEREREREGLEMIRGNTL